MLLPIPPGKCGPSPGHHGANVRRLESAEERQTLGPWTGSGGQFLGFLLIPHPRRGAEEPRNPEIPTSTDQNAHQPCSLSKKKTFRQ